MAPSAGVSVRWDRLYGRSLQCDFLPFGAGDLISGCSWWSRCLAGRKGGMPQDLSRAVGTIRTPCREFRRLMSRSEPEEQAPGCGCESRDAGQSHPPGSPAGL